MKYMHAFFWGAGMVTSLVPRDIEPLTIMEAIVTTSTMFFQAYSQMCTLYVPLIYVLRACELAHATDPPLREHVQTFLDEFATPRVLPDEAACRAHGVDELDRAQAFYHVLVDQRDRPGTEMAYVAEESVVITAPALIEHHELHIGFTGEIDEDGGVLKPNQSLREQYPLGTEGCWLVDRFYPDKLYNEFSA